MISSWMLLIEVQNLVHYFYDLFSSYAFELQDSLEAYGHSVSKAGKQNRSMYLTHGFPA